MPDRVKLTGTDNQIKRDAKLLSISISYNDKSIIHFEKKLYLGSTVQRLFTKEKHILKRTIVKFFLRVLYKP